MVTHGGMNELEELLRKRIASGLQRNNITRCSDWGCHYRVMGGDFAGPWRFTHHPWTRAMHDAEEELIVGQKAAQMGFTEVALNKTFYKIDIEGRSVLYILPNSQPDATDFSSSRFDPALELSEHLKNLFSDVANVGHKRAGTSSLLIRGSKSRSQLKSVPVSFLVLDEFDEMDQNNAVLAMERMSGQLISQAFMISTPTVPNFGINRRFRSSSQDHYCFKCPSCSRWTELDFWDGMKITAEEVDDPGIKNSYLFCKECGNLLPHETKTEWLDESNAEWVSTYENALSKGFWIPQLYSCVLEPWKIASSYLAGMRNPADEQEFYNSKLGQTHVVEGAKILDSDIDSCIANYTQGPPKENALITMGVDVGKDLHFEIDRWHFDRGMGADINLSAIPQVLKIGTIKEFEELENIIKQFRVVYTVIDASPERRKSLEFCKSFYGRAKMCFYATGTTGRQLKIHEEEDCSVAVERTSWLDMALSRFKNTTIRLPRDTPHDYRAHIQAPNRIYDRDKDGNLTGKYITSDSDADHFAHARNYSEIALPLVAEVSASQNIEQIL